MKNVPLLLLLSVLGASTTQPATHPEPEWTRIPQSMHTMMHQEIRFGDELTVRYRSKGKGEPAFVASTSQMLADVYNCWRSEDPADKAKLENWRRADEVRILDWNTRLRVLDEHANDRRQRPTEAKVVVLDGPNKSYVGVIKYYQVENVDMERYRQVRRNRPAINAGEVGAIEESARGDRDCYIARSPEIHQKFVKASEAEAKALLEDGSIVKVPPLSYIKVTTGEVTAGTQRFAEVELEKDKTVRGYVLYDFLQVFHPTYDHNMMPQRR